MIKTAKPLVEERLVRIAAGQAVLDGTLRLPEGVRATVLFAFGSGGGRHSPRDIHVAQVLNEAHLATLLIDLLNADEEAMDCLTAHLRFEIGPLTDRLGSATEWLAETLGLPIGYFGASTGTAAALMAATRRPDMIGAVVSRGGRPDLARPALPRVRAPTLLIVGGNDVEAIELNRMVLPELRCEKELVIVPGAGHLFEEPEALEHVAWLAREWFERHLLAAVRRTTGTGQVVV
jgi:pimeloyl-ACP methyl ester carboxylesterase